MIADESSRRFFFFLLVFSYVMALTFGIFYHTAGINQLVLLCAIVFLLNIALGVSSFFIENLVILFRLSILIVLAAFSIVTFTTGGVGSPAIAELVTPPLLAYFYRPTKDRYYFMVFAALLIISFWPLTIYGITMNLMPMEYEMVHSFIVIIFVFSVVTIYSFLFRKELAKKNRQLFIAMSDQKKTTKKLIQSEKLASLGVMLAGVGHELNNPLNFIAGGIDGLAKQVKGSKEAEPFVAAVLEGVNRAASIVHSLGHFSRDNKTMDEQVNLHEVIDNCLIMLQSKLKHRVEVVKHYSKWPVVIIGNEGKLHQAVISIISNAEESIMDKGTIDVLTKVSRNQIRLTISDTGVGISEGNLKKIGDPFFTTKAVGEGTGLGLSIAYEILHEHKARVEVTSEVSKGTNFTILFKT